MAELTSDGLRRAGSPETFPPMQMTLGGTREIGAGLPDVWRALLDPEIIASSAGTVESVEKTGDNHYSVVARIGVGFLSFRFELEVQIFDIVENTSAKMRIHGTGAGSTVDTVSSFQLATPSPEETQLDWTATTTIGGPMTAIGTSIVDTIARKVSEEFWQGFIARVSDRAAH